MAKYKTLANANKTVLNAVVVTEGGGVNIFIICVQ
jgi:hypothetical protein